MPTFLGVRIATESDEPAIYNLLMLMHREAGTFSFSDRKVRAHMAQGTRHEGGIVGVVDGMNGVEATVGLAITQAWYSEDWHLNELWNFVHPAYRKNGHAAKMVEFSKWCSDNMTIPLVIGAVMNKRTEAKIRLLKRLVPVMGGLFLYNNAPIDATVAARN
jgi:hypothetical protein